MHTYILHVAEKDIRLQFKANPQSMHCKVFIQRMFSVLLVQHYIAPARAATAPKPLQSAELFNFLCKIFEFHRDHFLPELERCRSQPEALGDVFTSAEESLQIYVAYCKCKAASHALLQEHRGFFEVHVQAHEPITAYTHTSTVTHQC